MPETWVSTTTNAKITPDKPTAQATSPEPSSLQMSTVELGSFAMLLLLAEQKETASLRIAMELCS